MKLLLELLLLAAPFVLACLQLGAVIRGYRQSRKRLAPEGPLSTAKDVFRHEPGWLYFQQWVQHGDHGQQLIEHFHITVRLPGTIAGDITLQLPAAMSMSRLESYSTALFERLAKGYFSVNGPMKGLPFDRPAQLALLRALTPLPQLATCRQLVARNGRLLLKLQRPVEPSAGPLWQPREVVLERSRAALEALAEEWTSLLLPKRFTR